MKNLTLILSILSILCLNGNTYSQTPDDMGNLAPDKFAKKGTFEIIVLDSLSTEPSLSIDSGILYQIEAARAEHDYVYLALTPNLTAKIYPRTLLPQINEIKE